MHIERVERELQRIYGGRPWLVSTDVLQAATPTVARLRAWGAPRCFVIAARRGAGPSPSPDDGDVVVLDLPSRPMMEAIHAAEEAARNLPEAVQAAVDRVDPDRAMRVIGPIFSDGRPVAGRAFWGARAAAWRALEDKVVIDAVWDAAAVPRAPSEVVPVALDALQAAAARLDRGHGTVWAGDATRGFHGGATYTCRVQGSDDAARAAQILAGRCERARVMPYLPGVPCSIHGIVFPNYVLVLRPAEMLTLCRNGGTGFLYGRAATFWDPPGSVREEMRACVRRVGDHLRATVGYRGAFTIDGIASSEGFRPTELNPRVGAALGTLVPDFPFSFLHDALVEGMEIDAQPEGLEWELVARADTRRHGTIAFVVDREFSYTVQQRLRFDGTEWRPADTDAPADGDLSIGPGPSGGYVMLQLSPASTPVGPSVAGRAVALVRYLDRVFGTGIGAVRAATG